MRRLPAIVGASLLLTGCGAGSISQPSHPSGPAASATAATCRPRDLEDLRQAADGRISGCVRVDVLRPGPHVLALDEYVQQLSPRPARATRSSDEPAATLRLSPSSGPPGSWVKVAVHLHAPVPHGSGAPQLCWQSCRTGLWLVLHRLHWTSRRSFRVRVRLPAAPWLSGGRLIRLRSGVVRIEVDCVVETVSCFRQPVEGSADFRLRVSRQPAWCPTTSDCAKLSVTPAAVRPGEIVRVSGFVPLTQSAGGSAFWGEPQLSAGRPRSPEVVIEPIPGESRLGSAALDVLRPPVFAQLGSTAPRSVQMGGLATFAGAPGDPSLVAWCDGDRVHISDHDAVAGFTTAAATPVLRRLGYQAEPDELCDAVVPLGRRAAAAAFVVSLSPDDLSCAVALETFDGGASWRPLPIPAGASPEGFGGFRDSAHGVEAVFARGVPDPKAPGSPLLNGLQLRLEQATDGGRSWHAVASSCPPDGACLQFGAYLPGSCGMGAQGGQPTLQSLDGGRSWHQPPLAEQPDTCGEAELVSTRSGAELVVNSYSSFTLERSTDGGRDWQLIGLPTPIGEHGIGVAPLPAPGGITVLPDGSLLLSGAQSRSGVPLGWQLLAPGSSAWCRASRPSPRLQLRQQQSYVTVIGRTLWWRAGGVHHLSVASVRC